MEPQNDDGQKLQFEAKLNEIIEVYLDLDTLEQSFLPFIVTKPDEEREKAELRISRFANFWQSCPQKFQEPCMKVFVDSIHNAKTTSMKIKMFVMLKTLVERGAVTSKLACDGLISNENLSYENVYMWRGSLRLVKEIISGLDYKGCRDILHLLLGKVQSLPIYDNISCRNEKLEVLFDLVQHILDRDTCLLPAYFGLNGVNKFFYDDKPHPQFYFGQLLSDVVESFRPTAQMASIIGRSKLLPMVGHSNLNSYVWRIFSNNLKFQLHGPLPYDKELTEPQHKLLSYVMEQPYSRDMVCSMLNLNKQQKIRCQAVGEQCVDMIIKAIENYNESDEEDDDDDGGVVPMETDVAISDEDGANPRNNVTSSRKTCSRFFWDHLSCQIIYFVLYQFTSFSCIVTSVLKKLKDKNLRKGRDNLMWLLLQFISGSIQKNSLEEFLPVLQLYEHLYPEVTPLPIPDVEKKSCTRKMAAICIWVHLIKKAQTDKVNLRGSLPSALHKHMELLQQLLESQAISLTDYKTALVSNAYSTHNEHFSQRMTNLIELIYGVPNKSTLLPGDVPAFSPTVPIDVKLMDSLTVHAKMSLIHSIVTRIMRLVQGKQNTWALSPSVVETYSRLLVYNEIESLGIKGFFGQLLLNVFKEKCWGILYTLIEMANYRLHHVQAHYRVQLYSQLHTILQMKQATNVYQLHLCIENAALHLITSLSNTEVQFQLYRALTEQKLPAIYSPDSEELNKVLVLTLARSMLITGSETQASTWCKDILAPTNQATPHTWSSHTLACFPQSVCEFYAQNPIQKDDKSVLRRNVETEYRKWKSMAGENDLINHFSSEGSLPLFICVLWKCLLDDNRIMPIAYKVLDNLGPRALGIQLRYFVDYMVLEISTAGANNLINRYVDSVSDLVWKWNITSLDRLVLCMALRSFEGNDAQVCFYIIQALLLRPQEFRNRVNDFVSENSPEHWKQNNWYEKHMAFHRKYPEKFFFENVAEVAQLPHNQYLPIHFSNVCLRFIPVFDILIHRFLELSSIMKSLETILDHLGVLYKFHSRPLTFLQNTLHYYEKILADKPNMKRKLVQTVAASLKDVKPRNWCLTDDYLQFLRRPSDNFDWDPEVEYYGKVVERMVQTMEGKPLYPDMDWRFNEFPNAQTHNLCITAIELMALPRVGSQVGRNLYELVLKYSGRIPRKDIFSWLNAVGIIATSLPENYWSVLNELVVEVLTFDINNLQPPFYEIFQTLNFSASYRVCKERRCSLLLALCHSFGVHASIGQLSQLTTFFRDHWKPLVRTENQFIYVCHILGPFLPRLYQEKTRSLFEITIDFYEMLENVDKSTEKLMFQDPITDFLYHVKYMFVGDGVKSEVEKIIRNLRPELQSKLKFISFHNPEQQQPQQQQSQHQQQQQQQSQQQSSAFTTSVNSSSFFVNTVASHLGSV